MEMINRVAVIGGCGHVGLPLSLSLAETGMETTIVDINLQAIEAIKNGKFPFLERGGQQLLDRSIAEKWRITYTSEVSAIKDVKAIIITIGTPVDEHLTPQLGPVFQCIESLIPFLTNNQTIILRSTLFPGTSQQIVRLLKKRRIDSSVCFCPERIAQGNALEELRIFPQIISSNDQNGIEVCKKVFRRLTDDLVELSLTEAELAKLFCNAWRYIQFSIANQFYKIATDKNYDFEKIRSAIRYKYPRNEGLPSSGFAAGPCLFKDTMQLAAFYRESFSLGHAAMLVNETLPEFLIDKNMERIKKSTRPVGILGMAFKPDNDDIRESLAYKLKKRLTYEGIEVLCTDIYVKDPNFVALTELLNRCEVIFVGCPHREYKGTKFNQDHFVVDCWNFFR